MKQVPFERSFATHPKSEFWSDLNELKPHEVTKSNGNKFWFNCDNCNHTFETKLSSISNGNWCPYCCIPSKKFCNKEDCKECFDKSFASHPKSKFWNKDNKLKPKEVMKNSRKKFKFDCNKCNHIFEIQVDSITKGSWCNFCSNNYLCDNEDCIICFNKSFASHYKSDFWSNKNTLNPRELFKNSHDPYIFNCICGHEFESSLLHVNFGHWCQYCCNSAQKLCKNNDCKICYNKSFAVNNKSRFWSQKNKLKPHEVAKSSGKNILFNCDKCKNEFSKRLADVTDGQWCPFCKNKTELKLFNWLKENYPLLIIKRQARFDWCKNTNHLLFDFYIEELNLLLELDGRQHFERVSNWEDPEKTKINDEIKDKCSIKNGFNLIRICQRIVWNNKEDWENQLKECIKKNNKSELIKIGSVYNN